MNKKQQTIDTYNARAGEMAAKFTGLGARLSDIEETFKLMDKANPFVLKIGCGNGRDAAEILKRTNNYLGIDISDKLIELAQINAPGGRFEVRDIENFVFPNNIDIIFAFASLLHTPKETLASILERAWNAMNPGGALRISMKSADSYKEEDVRDEFGLRTFYFYSQDDIEQLLKKFKVLKSEIIELRGQTWLEVLAQK